MSQPLVYVDTSAVREGALGRLKDAIGQLADFVEENEPRLVSYNVYFTEDGTQMTVVHVHADSASLDHHMEVAGPRFGSFADLLAVIDPNLRGAEREGAWTAARQGAPTRVRRRDRPRAACRVQPV